MKQICLFFTSFLFLMASQGQHVSTREDRAALFDYVYEKTLIREAFAPLKEKALEIDPRLAMQELRNEVINASNDTELYYSLKKLSAARKDRHLSIGLIEGGLELPPLDKGTAPLRFHPDFSDPDKIIFFVSDLGEKIQKYTTKDQLPSIGHELVTVNGRKLEDYLSDVSQYIRYSNRANYLRRIAYSLTDRDRLLPPGFYREELVLTLRSENKVEYTLSLPYLKEVDWQYGRVQRNYRGFELVTGFNFESFRLYETTDTRDKTLLLWWYGFRRDLPEATDELIKWASEQGKLDYNLIIDAVDSRGGSQGAYALARLTSRTFKTTGGNLKLSDITDDFIARYTESYVERKALMDGSSRETEDDGTWVIDWLHGPVIKGLAAGQEYSNNVPFKCAHLPHYSDWMMKPAETHFTGNMIIFLGPWGGSHLSQFAAMIKDNGLGYSLGMPDGGYSNTWEWQENLTFPISGEPVVRFMWNIGHTIRPNGEVLEGNPAEVDEYIPVTGDNYLNYKNILIDRAKELLAEE